MVRFSEIGLVNSRELFAKAVAGGYAITAFSFNNMEQMQAIISACAEQKSPVILQVSSGARKYANQTLLRYMAEGAVAYAKEYMHLTEEEGLVWGMIRTAMASVSDLCITPIQDLMDLDGTDRMNLPGTQTDANWTWRSDEGCMDAKLAEKLYRMTKLYGRLGTV